ncbi:MAG: ATP synthase F0 subunit B [Puniceicoccales bacterium]|nr:ATP synthase F0 subunit B [Puniceicoccales bacterium]
MIDFGELLRTFGVDWHLLVVQSLNFAVVSYLLYRFGFRSVVRLMDERRAKIESGLEYADRMRKEIDVFESSRAERIEVVKKEAGDIIKSAKNDAKLILEQGKVESRQLADNMVASAKREAVHIREQVIREAKGEIGLLVADITERVLQSQMSEEQRNEYAASAEKMLLSENLQ